MSGAREAPEDPRPRGWTAALAWTLLALSLAAIAGYFWLDRLLRAAGHPELAIKGSELPYPLMVVSAATVGAVLAARRPRHPVGWLLLTLALLVVGSGVGDAYARYGIVARPRSVPAAAQVAVLGDSFILWPACIGFVLLLTPTGSLPSPRWRWWAVASAVAPIAFLVCGLGVETRRYEFFSIPNPFYVPALAPVGAVVTRPALVVTMLGLALGGGSLVMRFRRAVGVERQQLRWVALAAILAAFAVAAAIVGILLNSGEVVGVSVAGYAVLLCVLLGAAILRYRLYDLDRIISRTLAYALLTVLLGLAYAAVVVALGQVLRTRSSLAVAAATLAVAAAFQPARRRVQELVDRRFNRRAYDAERTIAAFTVRLRQQIDLDALTTELLAVVDQTIQPASASLWIRTTDQRPDRTAPAP